MAGQVNTPSPRHHRLDWKRLGLGRLGPGVNPQSSAAAQARVGRAGPPAVGWLLTEPARSALDLAGFGLAVPWLARAPRGDGHPVLVLPGFLAGDMSTAVLRGFVRSLGYQVQGWDLGRNVGPTAEVVAGLPSALERLARRVGGPVSVIGWSLGGVYARGLARRHPDLVRQVITLGSPFAMRDLRQSRAAWTFERGAHQFAVPIAIPAAGLSEPVPVPATAVYSRRDGIVDWRACIDPPGPGRQNVEVRCSHLGFGHDATTLWVVADRLALPAGEWAPFEPPRALRPLYPDKRDPAGLRAVRCTPHIRPRANLRHSRAAGTGRVRSRSAAAAPPRRCSRSWVRRLSACRPSSGPRWRMRP